jgi:hypothetical protein
MPNTRKWPINYDFVQILLGFFDIIQACGLADLSFCRRND